MEAPEPGLALEKSNDRAGLGVVRRARVEQAANPGHGFVLGRSVEGRVQKLAGSHAQRPQNRLGIVADMQPHHVRLEIERHDGVDQLTGLIEIGRQIQQDDVRPGLPQAHL